MAQLKALLLFLLVIAVAPICSSSPTSTTEKGLNCSYIVNVETSCTAGAGTGDHVSLRFGDSAGNHVLAKHLKEPIEGNQEKPFQWCSSAKFKIEGPCVNQSVCYLYLKRIGADHWRPARARVHSAVDHKPFGPVDTFYFRRFIPSNVWHGYDYCDNFVRREHMHENSAPATSTHAMKYYYDHKQE
ncbi:hypothetical protein SUGI_0461350 [Cryptomeria japonica]|uniref:embryo-specific protein ATS3A n=1 Tax=Cryptomeria japonica TaxID=3369 RepID=UPI002408EF2D|nr:embryo-specific protein ATS3A [Cryptomeria japonica]GLJ24189.1 hypothetical protein SUGI_0461350 [Cryptomeria japonica]